MSFRVLNLVAALAMASLLAAAPASAQQLRGADLHPMSTDQDPSIIQREFDMLRAAGANSVRFDVFWTAVEWSGKGQYDPKTLSWLDWVFGQAQSHGLKVILDVWSTPCWASSAPAGVTLGCAPGWWNRPVRYYPPKSAQDYAGFAAFAAKRWLPSLAAIELWNEPNGTFLYAPDRAAAYASLVRAAYPAVKAVAPGLPVLMSLAGTDSSFLSSLYADGVRGYYDGIAVHPYNQPTLAGLTALRSYQLSSGDVVPLWVTEVGWSSGSVGTYLQGLGVTVMLTKLAALPYVAATEIYDMRDGGTSSDPEDHFGLLDTSLNPKPAWGAFASALSGLLTGTKAGARSRLIAVRRP